LYKVLLINILAGLLDPTLLLGEGGYYLTTLISAIQVVISIQRKEAALPNISDLQVSTNTILYAVVLAAVS